MKKYVLFVFWGIMTFTSAQAQIKMLSTPEKAEKKVDVYVYDSLVNVNKRSDGYQYLQGQKMFYVSCNGDFRRLSDNQILFCHKMVGKYFNFIDVKPRDFLKELKDPLILLEDNSTDTIRYVGNLDDNKSWVVVGYYEKAKNCYVGKTFVFIKDANSGIDIDEILSFETHKKISNISPGSLWKCTDISIKERGGEDYYWGGDDRCSVVLTFENPEYGKGYCYLEDRFGTPLKRHGNYWDEDKRDLFLAKFQEENEYKEYQVQQQKLAAIKKQETAKRKEALSKKYGAYNAAQIIQGKVRIGMTKKMCIESWGKPENINTTTGSFGTHEQWVYGDRTYLYFENGKLTSIQN